MAELTPDIAAKMLAADLRNLIKQVGEGGTLSEAERAQMHRHASDLEVTEEHARLRLSSLLRKWSLGQRLAKDEMAEISGLLPDMQSIARRKTKETYQRKLEDYESIYGQKPNHARTIKRWIKLGRDCTPPDLPPLDDPASMPAWWMRHMKQRVPPKILAAAGGSKADPPPPAEQPGTASVDPPPATADQSQKPHPAKPARKPVETHEIGFAAKLRQAEQDVADALADKAAAEAAIPFDAAAVELADRKYDRAMKRYREFQRDAEDIINREGRAWAEAEQHLSEPLNVMNQSLRSLMVRVATKVGLPREWFERLEPAFQDELDGVFATLAESDYQSTGEPFTLEAA